MNRTKHITGFLQTAVLCFVTTVSWAFDWHAVVPGKAPPETKTLIKNVSIFDGTSAKFIIGKDVVVKGNTIEGLVETGGEENKYDQVLDGKSGYLSPGLIDVHYHAVLGLEPAKMMTSPKSYIISIASWELEQLLKRGVTTVRDAGGDVAGLKRAIDEGYLTGPRIYPSQAVLGQYSGHVDFRNPNFLPKEWGGPRDPLEATGVGITANGTQQVLAATRDNLYKGAAQIKIAVSGGVISFTDPLYVHEFLPEEIKAAVRAAQDYGTYVMAHAHSAEPIKRAIKAGVKSIDHNSRADEEAVKMMAEHGVHISVQPLTAKQIMDAYPENDIRHIKAKLAYEGTADVMKWAKKYGVHMAWGTDLLNDIKLRNETQLQDLTIRKQWFTSPEIMIQATGNGGATVALSGKRNPYGKLGVIEKGALADILIYSKNPLEDVSIVEDYENNLKLIMKDGWLYKNTLVPQGGGAEPKSTAQ